MCGSGGVVAWRTKPGRGSTSSAAKRRDRGSGTVAGRGLARKDRLWPKGCESCLAPSPVNRSLPPLLRARVFAATTTTTTRSQSFATTVPLFTPPPQSSRAAKAKNPHCHPKPKPRPRLRIPSGRLISYIARSTRAPVHGSLRRRSRRPSMRKEQG